jgi:hypothetical protein
VPEFEVPEKKKRNRKRTYICEHAHESYYAKGYCQACYHQVGRYKRMAKACKHQDMPDYAKGLCKSCYINTYRKEKRREGKKAL